MEILIKQWLHEYMAYEEDTQPLDYVRIRFARAEGMTKWWVFEIAAILPMILQFALLLFFTGLAAFLQQLDPLVRRVGTVLFILWLTLFIGTSVAPAFAFYSDCPYKTPLLRRPLQLLSIALFIPY